MQPHSSYRHGWLSCLLPFHEVKFHPSPLKTILVKPCLLPLPENVSAVFLWEKRICLKQDKDLLYFKRVCVCVVSGFQLTGQGIINQCSKVFECTWGGGLDDIIVALWLTFCLGFLKWCQAHASDRFGTEVDCNWCEISYLKTRCLSCAHFKKKEEEKVSVVHLFISLFIYFE